MNPIDCAHPIIHFAPDKFGWLCVNCGVYAPASLEAGFPLPDGLDNPTVQEVVQKMRHRSEALDLIMRCAREVVLLRDECRERHDRSALFNAAFEQSIAALKGALEHCVDRGETP